LSILADFFPYFIVTLRFGKNSIVAMRNYHILVRFFTVWQDGHDADDAKKSTADMTAFVSSSTQFQEYLFNPCN
jgi:hypothetical protein